VTYKLTAMDLATLRKADMLSVAYNLPERGKTRVCAIKERHRTEKDPFAEDIRVELEIPVDVSGYSFNGCLSTYLTTEQKSNIRANELVRFYPEQGCPASSIIAMLKTGDDVSLEFIADAFTTEAMDKRSNGFHCDKLKLHVWRGDAQRRKHFTFILDMSICEDNSARMVRGLPPRHDSDTRLVD
jgi:hypothetical protein